MPTVWIIEDEEAYVSSYHQSLEGRFRVVSTKTIEEATAHVTASHHTQYDCIVIDACIGRRYPNGPELAHAIRRKYHGVLVANSSEKALNLLLINQGCTHATESKQALHELLFRLFPAPRT